MISNIQEKLFSYAVQWSFTSLQDVKKILRHDWNPHEKLSIYHVAWTNGKGSTCAMLSQVLRKQFGKKVWLYVSPHVISCNERVQINWAYISDEDYDRFALLVLEKAKPVGVQLSYFALITLIWIYYFLEKNVDCAVIEVGLWGTLDTTNLRSQPLATFITSIWFDHTRLLWSTRSQIQRNKMGIMKAWVPCYTPVNNTLMHHGARVKKAVLNIVNQWISTSLLGDHQIMNAGLVYSALLNEGYDSDAIKKWLMEVTHPWRLQFVRDWLLIDWAHNKQWIIALWKYIDSIRWDYDKIITVFGTSKYDKEFDAIVPYLIQWDENYCVAPSHFRERAVKVDEYSEKVWFEIKPQESLESLLIRLEWKWLVLVYGSLYLVSDVLDFTIKN